MSFLFFLLTLLTMPELQRERPQSVSQTNRYLSPGQSFPPTTRLEQNGFEIFKQTKRVRLPDSPHPVTVSYATVTKNGKKLARFDGFIMQWEMQPNSAGFPCWPHRRRN